MGIQNFPTALQPIIQQGFLEREFMQALRSRLAYRSVAQRTQLPIRIGETLTKTRAGLKPVVTTPLSVASNTNLDNGLTPVQGWGVEQWTITMALYAATNDLNMVTDRVGIASQFLQNAYVNGEQAARSLDELARNALFGAYMAGSTRVRTTLGSAGPTISVDDIRGFQQVTWQASGSPAGGGGVVQTVSNSYPVSVLIGSDVYSIGAVAADGTNVSTAPNGISGTLTTVSGNITTADGTALNAVQAQAVIPTSSGGLTTSTGSVPMAGNILRPSGRASTAALQATDTLTMSNLLDAVAYLRSNAVPEIDGAYNCYLDPRSSRQLFSDPDFKQLFQGATSASQVFKSGMTNDFLGLRFIPTTEALIQASPSVTGSFVRRPIIVGAAALVEATFAGMGDRDVAPANAIVSVVDDVAMVTREPLDRLQQIIAQSWYWIGGYAVPTDTTVSAVTIPTAQALGYKRAVVIEHIG